MDIVELARTKTEEEFLQILAELDKKKKRALERFRGELSIPEIREGISVCIHNAESLAADAGLLFTHKRWPRSFVLSISALEEVGKVVVLHSMVEIPRPKPKVWRQHWLEAHRHQLKTSYGGTRTWHDELYSQIGCQLSRDDLDGKLLERLRQGGLYIDFDQDDREWRVPSEITEKMAETQHGQAQISVSQIKYYEERGLFSIECLQRRAEICRPIYDTYEEIPERGEDRSRFFLRLHELRKHFFNEIVDQGILGRFLPSELTTNRPPA